MGHNYRNGALFSNNITSSTDFDYAVRNTAGKREISLASCTDDSKSRLIIWAKEK